MLILSMTYVRENILKFKILASQSKFICSIIQDTTVESKYNTFIKLTQSQCEENSLSRSIHSRTNEGAHARM